MREKIDAALVRFFRKEATFAKLRIIEICVLFALFTVICVSALYGIKERDILLFVSLSLITALIYAVFAKVETTNIFGWRGFGMTALKRVEQRALGLSVIGALVTFDSLIRYEYYIAFALGLTTAVCFAHYIGMRFLIAIERLFVQRAFAKQEVEIEWLNLSARDIAFVAQGERLVNCFTIEIEIHDGFMYVGAIENMKETQFIDLYRTINQFPTFGSRNHIVNYKAIEDELLKPKNDGDLS